LGGILLLPGALFIVATLVPFAGLRRLLVGLALGLTMGLVAAAILAVWIVFSSLACECDPSSSEIAISIIVPALVFCLGCSVGSWLAR